MRWLLTLSVLCLATTTHADEAQRIFAKADAASVRIDTADGNGSGSFVAIRDRSADVLTCAHVVGAHGAVTVSYTNLYGREAVASGMVVAKDIKSDLALVRIDSRVLASALPVSEIDPDLFDELYVVGAPLGLRHRAATERLDAKHSIGWAISGTVIPGMSGSSVLNERGEVVCVIKSVSTNDGDEYTQLGYCAPLPAIRAFLKGPTK